MKANSVEPDQNDPKEVFQFHEAVQSQVILSNSQNLQILLYFYSCKVDLDWWLVSAMKNYKLFNNNFGIAEKPIEFIKKLADTEVGEIPGTATLECELSQEGVPVKWYHDNTVLAPSNKYKMIDEGTIHKLEISDIDGEDEGKYSVIAKGQKSEASLFVEGTFYCFLL